MARNLSYFVETLPNAFDSWNITHRQSYYTSELEDFVLLENNTQTYIATHYSKDDVRGFYYFIQTLENLPENGTLADFFNGLESYQPTPPKDPCDDTFALDRDFVLLFIFPLVFIVFLMSFFKARKNLWLNICKGRPGVLYPINFIDEYERRWLYTAVFVLLAHRILYLFDGIYYVRFTINQNLGFLQVFVVLLNVIMLCIEFYPMLACIVMRRSILANILGFLLNIAWFTILLIKYLQCPIVRNRKNVQGLSTEVLEGKADTSYYEGISAALYESVLFLANVVICVGYLYDLVLNIKRHCNKNRKLSDYGKEQSKLFDSQEELSILYINSLLKRKPPPPDMPLKERLKHNLRYTRMLGFKYPPRVICTVFIGLYALYKTATEITFVTWYYFDWGREIVVQNEPTIIMYLNGTQNYQLALVYVRTALWTMVTSCIASFVIQSLLMLHFVSQYRQHIRKFFAGDHSWHYEYTSSPAGAVVAGMRYSGYQVAFLIYGYVLVAVILFLVIMLFAGFIVIPLATKSEDPITRFFIDRFITLWPAIAVGLLIYFAQLMMAKYLFLQDKGAYVALTNRRMYHVISFFLFFFNVVLGFFSCLKRILFSALFGTLLISRLDRCLLMRGFERFDSGFSSYLGMLTVDMNHNHPIVKGFVHILKEEAKASQVARSGDGADEVEKLELQNGKAGSQAYLVATEVQPVPHIMTAKKRVRNKYWKFVTLLNNPSLVFDKFKEDLAEMKKATQNGTMTKAIDHLGGAASIFLGTGIFGGHLDSADTVMSTHF